MLISFDNGHTSLSIDDAKGSSSGPLNEMLKSKFK